MLVHDHVGTLAGQVNAVTVPEQLLRGKADHIALVQFRVLFEEQSSWRNVSLIEVKGVGGWCYTDLVTAAFLGAVVGGVDAKCRNFAILEFLDELEVLALNNLDYVCCQEGYHVRSGKILNQVDRIFDTFSFGAKYSELSKF